MEILDEEESVSIDSEGDGGVAGRGRLRVLGFFSMLMVSLLKEITIS